MVFFDDINVALEAMKWIRSRLPLASHLHSQVAMYSQRSKRAKVRVFVHVEKETPSTFIDRGLRRSRLGSGY